MSVRNQFLFKLSRKYRPQEKREHEECDESAPMAGGSEVATARSGLARLAKNQII